MITTIKNLDKNEIWCVVGGDCFCECCSSVYGWGHPDGKKGMVPNSRCCHYILCAEKRWNQSSCTESFDYKKMLMLEIKSTKELGFKDNLIYQILSFLFYK